MNLVEKIAKKMKWAELPYEDRLIAGYEGLKKAKEKFDPSKNVKFETFAYYFIRGKIMDTIIEYDNLIKIPKNLKQKIWKVIKTKKQLKQKLDYEPSIEEIGEKLKMKKEEVKKLLKINECSKVLSLSNKIKSEKETNDFRELTLKILKFLTIDEQISVANYFGFELENNNKMLERKPSARRIEKIIGKIQKNSEIMHFLNENVDLLAS